MKRIAHRYQSRGRKSVCALVAILCLVCVVDVPSAASGPIFDPFLERFQVGAFADPDEIQSASGYPMGLLEPIRIDRGWIAAARMVLSADLNDTATTYVTQRLLAVQNDSETTQAWALEKLVALSYLDQGTWTETDQVDPAEYLGPEILGSQVFAALRAGDVPRAAAAARQLSESQEMAEWNPRAAFVWELRARVLEKMNGVEASAFAAPLWSSMLSLGPFDSGNAWALWIRHRRDLSLPLVAPELATQEGEKFVLGLRKGWIAPADLYSSAFETDAQAAIGAHVFRSAQLSSHMDRFTKPPSRFDREGSWVKGARFARRGQAAAYEDLAQRTDISAGWRLDVWRRASELRFLAGDFDGGWKNLERALEISARSEGTLSLRRRLRHWCEQSMVLALAKQDAELAGRIYELALQSFHEEELDAFESETSYWKPRVDPGTTDSGDLSGADLKARAKRRVESGRAASLVTDNGWNTDRFVAACDTPLWDAWIRWGLALADAPGLSVQRRTAARLYTEALNSSELDGEAKALHCVALRLGETEAWERILTRALEFDVSRKRGDRFAASESVIPDLLPQVRGSELDRHALLGYCLAMGDQRGVLGLATELPAKGLGPNEKLRFLYPLPAAGAVRRAIEEQSAEPALVLAIARNESLFEANVRSRAGALGFMQIMPFHYQDMGALPGENNWACPGVSIAKAARILADDGRRYQGDPYLTVAAYNAGPGAAKRWLDQLGGVPDRDIYLAWIGYPETRRYVEKVLMDREIYDWIISSAADAALKP